MLGRKIEVLQTDDQNKPDVASRAGSSVDRHDGVDALADGAASSSGLAVSQIAKEKKRATATGPATSDLTGKQCSPSPSSSSTTLTHWRT